MKINVIEIPYQDPNVLCPFCKTRISDADTGEITPCQHTLFAAHDEGFEYCDARTKHNLGAHSGEDIFESFDGDVLNGLTKTLTIPKTMILAKHVPAPSFFGEYYGFAPAD